MGNMDKKPQITKENVKALFDSPYVRVADLQYAPGKHYYDATRRTMEDMVAVKPEEEFENMLPDAVSCIVILAMPGEEPKLLLSYEFRYPAGHSLPLPQGAGNRHGKYRFSPHYGKLLQAGSGRRDFQRGGPPGSGRRIRRSYDC